MTQESKTTGAGQNLAPVVAVLVLLYYDYQDCERKARKHARSIESIAGNRITLQETRTFFEQKKNKKKTDGHLFVFVFFLILIRMKMGMSACCTFSVFLFVIDFIFGLALAVEIKTRLQ